MYLNLKRYEMKTSNQALRMYIVHKLFYDFIEYSWSNSTNTGNITFRLYLI